MLWHMASRSGTAVREFHDSAMETSDIRHRSAARPLGLGFQRNIAIATLVSVVAGCGFGGEETVRGQIDDESVTLTQETAGPGVWLELANVGSTPCELLIVMSSEPEDLPLDSGRVRAGSSGTDHRSVEEMFVEVDGEPRPPLKPGEPVTVGPGELARVQVAFIGIPDEGERVVVCNGAGDYERGRYAVLAFDR